MENTEDSYQFRLRSIRQMPQSLVQETANKKESVRDLRIESYLAWADLAWTLSSVINLHPETQPNVLMRAVRSEKGKLPHPELAETLLFELDIKKDVTQSSLRKLKSSLAMEVVRGKFENPLNWDKDASRKIGTKVFKLIVGKSPKGDVYILDTFLAVGLLVDSNEDLRKLRKEEINIGGFYRPWQEVFLNGERIAFPLIVVMQSISRGGTVRHEQEHAVNNAIIHTLEHDRDETGNRWGGKGRPYMEDIIIDNTQGLVDVMQRKILPYALSHAKDEILAGYLENHDFTYIEALLDRDGVYNYFQDIVSILKKRGLVKVEDEAMSKVEDMFWENYKPILERNVEVCKNTLNLYREYGFQKREDLFPFVLAQIPLIEWEKVVGQNFYAEIKSFWSGQMRLKSAIVKAAFRKGGGFKKTARSNSKTEVAMAAYQALWNHGMIHEGKILKLAFDNQLESLYEMTAMFDKEIGYQNEQSRQILQKVVNSPDN